MAGLPYTRLAYHQLDAVSTAQKDRVTILLPKHSHVLLGQQGSDESCSGGGVKL